MPFVVFAECKLIIQPWILGLVACLSLFPLTAFGDDSEGFERSNDKPLSGLIVGTKHSPPFAFKNSDGHWTGISIELWEHLSDELDLEFEYRELTLEQMLEQLESGEIDAAVAAISVTAERHQRIEFCHPHFTTGLGIAAPIKSNASIWTLARRVVSTRLLAIVGVMTGILVVCGVVFWLLERKVNENLFGGGRRKGIGMGVWWSATMLLGHKGVIPVSTFGRVLAICAMLFSILLLSLLTGVIASVLTVKQLDTGIVHPSDLTHVRVVTVNGSTSADYLRRRRIPYQTRDSAERVLEAIAKNAGDAAVYDESLLRYMANHAFAESIQVLPVSFNTQEYAIGLPPNSQLRKPLNEEILRFRATDSWDELVFRYLGQ